MAGILGLVAAGPPRSLGIAAVHLLSAGIWGGGIMVMAALRPPAGWNGPEGKLLVERFGRVALVAFLVTALTGLVQATDHLHDVSELWSTAYGAVLSLKCAGVLAMMALSITWRRRPSLARIDGALAVAVVGVTAVLAAFPAQA